MVSKTCPDVTVKGITPTLRPTSRMAPVNWMVIVRSFEILEVRVVKRVYRFLLETIFNFKM